MEACDVGFEGWLVVFDGEQVVCLLVLDQLASGLDLGVRGIGGDDASGQRDGVEQGFDGLHFTGLVGHLNLVQDHMLFVRLAHPDKHFEAISSRPLLLHGVATQTRHAGQIRLTVTSTHAKQAVIQATLTRLASFLNSLKSAAEQLTEGQRLRAILARAFAKFILPVPAPRLFYLADDSF